MLRKRSNSNGEQPSTQTPKQRDETALHLFQTPKQENMLAALALVLGPETDYTLRLQATRRLARQGPALLPLVLTTLNSYPEITTPAWPWWPPQYEHCSRLLIHLSRASQLRLNALLQHSALSQPLGPVLWASVIEAAGLLPDEHYEELLREGLATSWTTVRYAAAMALAQRAGKGIVSEPTIAALRAHLSHTEPISVQLAAAFALLRYGDAQGIETLLRLVDPLESYATEEARKAAVFVLATELPTFPVPLLPAQREHLMQLLLFTLQDHNEEIALHAAHALSIIASPSLLPPLASLLDSSSPRTQITVLTALEEVASRNGMRRVIQQQSLPGQVVPFLRSETPEVRRQASYTLAAFGGEYAAAVLGTTLLNTYHPGQIEAIEGLRLLHGVLRGSTRTKVVRWLLDALHSPQEEIQITALDSLSYLAWQARTHNQKTALSAISSDVMYDGTLVQLLHCPHAWVRQRAVELFGMLDSQANVLQTQLISLLHTDEDSGVRACITYTFGQIAARWAIPDLIHTLLDEDEHVAETALNALEHLASLEDSIVCYVVQELALWGAPRAHSENRLAHAAQLLLKKWRK